MDPSKAILGVTWGVGEESVRTFLRSVAATGFDGRVVLFAANTPAADVDAMRRACDIIEVDWKYPRYVPQLLVWVLQKFKSTRGLRRHYPQVFLAVGRILRATPGSPIARDMEFRLQGLQALRYQHYFDYLESHEEIRVAMISDLRDVILQSDPFVAVDGLEVYIEEPATGFGYPGFNSTGIQDLYGIEALKEFQSELASCSGVTIGTREAMLGYLGKMRDELARHLIPLGPHDQGVHNFLLHSGRLPDAIRVPNGTGRVATLGLQADIRRDDSGTVLNADGTVPAVVHQYDRFPWLDRAIRDRLDSTFAES